MQEIAGSFENYTDLVAIGVIAGIFFGFFFHGCYLLVVVHFIASELVIFVKSTATLSPSSNNESIKVVLGR